jgi:hypothetical protein
MTSDFKPPHFAQIDLKDSKTHAPIVEVLDTMTIREREELFKNLK